MLQKKVIWWPQPRSNATVTARLNTLLDFMLHGNKGASEIFDSGRGRTRRAPPDELERWMAEPPEDCLTGLIEYIREVFGLDTCGTTEFKFEPRSTIMMPAAPKVNANEKKTGRRRRFGLALLRIPRPIFSRSLPITSFMPNIMILMILPAALASVVLRQLNPKLRYPNREGRRE
jgi:hypothetical protein